MRFLGAMLVVLCLLAGCTESEKSAIQSKCDASLRSRIEQLATSSTDEAIDILGKASGTIDDARKARLTEAGVELGTVTGDAFVGRVHASHVAQVAQLDFVKNLQLAQVREPLGR